MGSLEGGFWLGLGGAPQKPVVDPGLRLGGVALITRVGESIKTSRLEMPLLSQIEFQKSVN